MEHARQLPEWADAAQFELRRRPLWAGLLKVAWRPFVAVREDILPAPFMPAMAWMFDELLRQFVLLCMSELKPIRIEIPTMNNSHSLDAGCEPSRAACAGRAGRRTCLEEG